VATYDVVPQAAKALAGKYGAEAVSSLEELFATTDAVVVAATNDQLVPLSLAAVRAGKHVVVEKPAAAAPPRSSRSRRRRPTRASS